MTDKPYRILRIPVLNVSCYLVYNDREAVLVDTGRKGSGEKVIEMLEYVGLNASSLKLVIITHGHYDHAGSASKIKALTGAPVAIHKDDANRLREGFGPLPDGTRWKAKLLVWGARIFLKRLGRIPAMEPDIILDENMELDQYGFRGRIIHTPGHTAGSVIVFLEGGETFVGDTLFGISNKQIFPPFADHPELLLESWKKLLDMPATYFYPGHGMKISKLALEKEYPSAKKRYGKG